MVAGQITMTNNGQVFCRSQERGKLVPFLAMRATKTLWTTAQPLPRGMEVEGAAKSRKGITWGRKRHRARSFGVEWMLQCQALPFGRVNAIRNKLGHLCRYSIPLVVRLPLRTKARQSPGQQGEPQLMLQQSRARAAPAPRPAGRSTAHSRAHTRLHTPLTTLIEDAKAARRLPPSSSAPPCSYSYHTPRTALSIPFTSLFSSALRRHDAKSAARMAVHVSLVRRRRIWLMLLSLREAEMMDEQRMLAEALGAISLLVSASLSATLFPLKWQLIRDRLNRLHAGLADITVDDSGGGEEEADRCEAFVTLLRDAAATSGDALEELVPRSQGRHYGGGKLRLRSDLDVLAAALDALVARLDEVYASGALTRARALVVPRPAAGATRDDVRFYVRDLFARLRVGASEMRREAAAALAEALRDDEKCAVRVVVSDVPDGVGVLVALLECPDPRVQEEALEAVSVIAGSEAHRGDLVVAGVIAPVVRVLDAGAGSSTAAKERAARVLCKLTENSDNAWAVAAHGGVTALLNVVSTDHGTGSGELVCAACRVLRSLAGVDEIRKYMVADAGAVPALVSLSQSATTDDAARIQSMELLAAISSFSGDGSAREAVVREGAVESFVRALDPSSPTRSSKAREVALRTIDAVCLSPPTTSTTDRLLAAGFLDRVLSLLRNGDGRTLQHCALKAAHRKAMGDAGFMPEMVNILRAAKSPEAREMAAEALCALVSVHRNRKRFVQDERNVAQVLQLLGNDEEIKPTPAKRFLLSTLMHLTDSSTGRRKIMSSEHKLAETNVPDAKRIVKKLGGSKLRSIFHGIWRSPSRYDLLQYQYCVPVERAVIMGSTPAIQQLISAAGQRLISPKHAATRFQAARTGGQFLNLRSEFTRPPLPLRIV
ncbi:hypothetical protein HU200_005170 [Digitaria exilis]|uniref:DUF7032 domain-containing protein n=1 Tax=Digitaria exilis TaxID=1010633 RepID=A0A835FTQ3_9POAL|nr:hypothetical protein HU200_005170 [Digitaria exilis]